MSINLSHLNLNLNLNLKTPHFFRDGFAFLASWRRAPRRLYIKAPWRYDAFIGGFTMKSVAFAAMNEGRSPCGRRVVKHTGHKHPQLAWPRITLLAPLHSGVMAPSATASLYQSALTPRRLSARIYL